MKQNIIYEDQDILVVHKPAGIATQTARLGQQDMVSELKNYLAQSAKSMQSTKSVQPVKTTGSTNNSSLKEPYLGLIHRLDQPVSGILVFAKNSRAAAGLSAQAAKASETGGMKKHYYAVVCGKPVEASGMLVDYLLKNSKTNLSEVVDHTLDKTGQAKIAKLHYQITAQKDDISKLDIELYTGRHHQIRVQLSHAGFPILGDSKYGSSRSREVSDLHHCRNVALCAYRLEFVHPVSGKKLDFSIDPQDKIFQF